MEAFMAFFLIFFLSHLPLPPSLSASLALPLPRPPSLLIAPLSPRLPSLPLFPHPPLAPLLSPSDLTVGLCAGITLLTLSLPLSLSGGKSHTHQFAGSVPDERARKENINEAPQPINT